MRHQVESEPESESKSMSESESESESDFEDVRRDQVKRRQVESESEAQSESKSESSSESEFEDVRRRDQVMRCQVESESEAEAVSESESNSEFEFEDVRRRGQAQRCGMKMNDVNMPNGNSVKITVPAPSQCKCEIRAQTNLIKLHLNRNTEICEYEIVSAQMQETVKSHPGGTPSYNIVSIEKVQNCCLWKRYRNYQRELSLDQRFINEKMLFHGSNAVEDILKRGFDERHSNTNGMFGAGIYFAQHSSKSNQYAFGLMGGKGCKSHADKNCKSCLRKMLLCRVTLGHECKKTTAEKLSHPPPNYHSVVGIPSPNGLQYPEFVVYRGEQAYPEYVITYYTIATTV